MNKPAHASGMTMTPPPPAVAPGGNAPDTSVLGTVLPFLKDPTSLTTMLGAAAAGGLAGGAYEAAVPGDRRETPSQRRMRILKNALMFAGGSGLAAGTGLTAYKLLTTSEKSPESPVKGFVPNAVFGAAGAARGLYNKYKHRADNAANFSEQFAGYMNHSAAGDPAKLPAVGPRNGVAGWLGSDLRGLDNPDLDAVIRQSGRGPANGPLDPAVIDKARRMGLNLDRGILGKGIPMKNRALNTLNAANRTKGPMMWALGGALAPTVAPKIVEWLSTPNYGTPN